MKPVILQTKLCLQILDKLGKQTQYFCKSMCRKAGTSVWHYIFGSVSHSILSAPLECIRRFFIVKLYGAVNVTNSISQSLNVEIGFHTRFSEIQYSLSVNQIECLIWFALFKSHVLLVRTFIFVPEQKSYLKSIYIMDTLTSLIFFFKTHNNFMHQVTKCSQQLVTGSPTIFGVMWHICTLMSVWGTKAAKCRW
jgi:hypothetical protein